MEKHIREIKQGSRALDMTIDGIMVVLGTAMFAFATYYFITPSNIAPGGVSGIAILVNYLTDAPVGIISAAINFPLLIIGWKKLGREFLLKTILSIVSFTIIYDYILTPLNIPVYEGERLMASLFGGILTGIGLGIVFYCAGSTGGSDIITKLIQQRFPHIQLGRILLMFDFVIVAVSAVIFRSVESALYAIITIFATSQLIDVVVYSSDKGKLMYVFTSHYREISDEILKMDRGVTLLKGEGGFTNKECKIILCALRANEYHQVKKIIRRIDPDAFVIVSDSSETMGEGFKSMSE